MKENGISHPKITSLWPQSNSDAENFMKPLTKAIQSSHAKERDWKKDLYRFMLNYRAIPQCTTGVPPSQLLFNRKIRTKLPQVETDDDSQNTNLDVKQNDEHATGKMKENVDRKGQERVSDLKIGETALLVKAKKTNSV